MKIKKLRYNRRKVFIGLFLFLLLIGVTIGYAFITSNLNVEGTARFTNASWNIHFDNYSLMSGSVANLSAPTITDTSITFSARVEKAGDFYGFTVDVENEGNINARVSNFSVTPDFSEIGYVESSITYDNGRAIQVGDVLPSNQSKTIKVILKYKEDAEEYLYPLTDQDITVTISLDYEQYVDALPVWELPVGKTASTLTLGDEICADDQCFNFIKYDGDDVVMLAKYNLNVGNNTQTGTVGIQNPLALGENSDTSTQVNGYWPATVAFSTNNYWSGTTEDDVYDAENYAGTPGTATYSVAYYVEQYKTKLTNDYHATIKEARLLTYSEATDENIGCSPSGYYCPTTGDSAFITNATYWTATYYNSGSMFVITQSGGYIDAGYDDDTTIGVRPVIVVTKSNLE